MKKKEWDRRIELDLQGVQTLGAALLLRASNRLARAKDQLSLRLDAKEPANVFKWPFGVEHYDQEVKRWEKEHRELEIQLQGLAGPDHVLEGADKLSFWDFRFRWDHLRDHTILVGYLTDSQPDLAVGWDRTTPIAERWDEVALVSLRAIFFAECERMLGRFPEEVPVLRSDADFTFYLTVWTLCEVERSRGQPQGRRWDDGLENAASYAWSIRSDALKSGSPIANDEAIRRSLEKFEIISASKFDEHPDKKSVVVSDAGSEGGRLAGAIKAVRKQLLLLK